MVNIQLLINSFSNTTERYIASVRARLSPSIRQNLDKNYEEALKTRKVTKTELFVAFQQSIESERINRVNLFVCLGIVLFVLFVTPVFFQIFQFLISVRCFLPNNYLVWEAVRPIQDCKFCRSIEGPLVLQNITRVDFAPFAYSSQPIIIKNAVAHWPALTLLNYSYLKNLYEKVPGALDEDCQFLNFRSADIKSLRDFFSMSKNRVEMKGETDLTWYVGWSNCHPVVLEELRKLYPRPHFLPEDAEMPNTDYIFLGYEQGAFMHLDYIPRLMWQAQLQGNKTWVLAPTPECDNVCHTFSFYVEPGDAVLVDTRMWYHGTSIPKGEFALTIQSEYG